MNDHNSPLVSIIIPTYNRRELLKEAVASCLAQTYPHWEALIVDDGSTDGTGQEVGELLRGLWAGKPVRYCFKPNGGASSAKNHGLRLAQGEYVQYLDSDDLLRPEKLACQVEAMHQGDGVVDSCLCFGRLGPNSCGWGAAQRIGERCDSIEEFIERQCARTVHVIHTEAPLWRRAFLPISLAWREDLSVAEEWEYHIRLLTLHPRFVFVEEDLFWVRAHDGEQLSKEFGSLSHTLSFCSALQYVDELLRPISLWTPEVRAGLVLRARTAYISLLRTGDRSSLRDFEDWFLRLAWTVPDHRVAAAVWSRRLVGSALFLKLFDVSHRGLAAVA